MNIITDWIKEVRESYILADILAVMERNGVQPIILGYRKIKKDKV